MTRKISALVVILFFLCFVRHSLAELRKLGNVVIDGSWSNSEALADVPILGRVDLVWNSKYKAASSVGGGGWYFPVLDSEVILESVKSIKWHAPFGEIVSFQATKSEGLVSLDRRWHAQVDKDEVFVSNARGTVFVYVDGKLSIAKSPSGKTCEFIYKKNDLTEVRLLGAGSSDERDGNFISLVSLSYDQYHRCIELNVLQKVHRFEYESKRNGLLLAWDQPSGNTVEFSYTDFGLLKQVQRWSNAINGQQVKISEGSYTFTCQYISVLKGKSQSDAEKDPVNWRLIDDGVYTYSYLDRPKGTFSSKFKKTRNYFEVIAEDYNGVKQSMVVSGEDACETIVNPYGQEFKNFFYKAPGKPFNGKLWRVEQNGITTCEKIYDPKTGWLVESIDQNGESTYYEYDSKATGKNWEVRLEGKNIKMVEFDPQPIRISQGTDRTTAQVKQEFEYDSQGRVIAQKDSEGNITRIQYNIEGSISRIQPPEGPVATFIYGDFGRIVESSQEVEGKPVGQGMKAEYDALDRMIKQKAPDGTITEFRYNIQGKVSEILRNNVRVVSYGYDEAGNLIEELDVLKRKKRMEWDIKGRMLAEILPDGSTTRFEVDKEGRRIAQIDGNGNKITFTYDIYGKLTKQTNALGENLTWTYDATGLLAGKKNGEQTISYSYDEAKQLKLLDYGLPGQQVAYSYDEKGRVLIERTPSCRQENFYDKSGRVAALRLTDLRGSFQSAGSPALSEQVIRYTYNWRGQKTAVTLSEALPSAKADSKPEYKLLQQSEYDYDYKGRLEGIRSNGQSLIKNHYDGNDRLVLREYANGMKSSYTYTSAGLLNKMEVSGGPIAVPMLYLLEWDVAGQLTRRRWHNQAMVYDYDGAGRLIQAKGDAGYKDGHVLEFYTYDKAGNILEKKIDGVSTIMSYNAANQLVTSTSLGAVTTCSYDKAGRMTMVQGPEGLVKSTYGWLDKVVSLERGARPLAQKTNLSTSGDVPIQQVSFTPSGAALPRLGFDYYPDGHLAAKGILPADTTGLVANAGAAKGLESAWKRLKSWFGSTEEEPLTPNGEQVGLQVQERYVWDGLGLLRKNDEVFVIEPHVSGGAVVASSTIGATSEMKYYINDLLGTTLAEVTASGVRQRDLTSFGLPKKTETPLPKPESIKAPETP